MHLKATMWFLFFVLLNCYLVTANPSPLLKTFAETTCQRKCHGLVDGKINVHLVPHSHDDVGWLKTYNEYYTGDGDFDSSVKTILDTTIQELRNNADRRFIQVETAFFFKWWNDQHVETRNAVIDLINKGQLEIVNGAWSMNDEAASHYHSIIDQFTWGFRILEDTVGKCGRPKIGWQIDPFGHSREHASIVKQLGFEGLVVGRIDFRDKIKRQAEKNLDFLWNTNDNFDNTKLFTTMFPSFYGWEGGFCFDASCSDEITDANVKDKVSAFATILDGYKNFYQTKNIMIPMGADFAYQNAAKNFENIDKLIEGFKDHETYNVIYSTPSCYIEAVQSEVTANTLTLSEKTDDFFPYASDAHSFWTGYFTSRPTSKRFERVGNNILQSAKQLTTLSRIQGNDDDKSILKLRMAMGVLQHHDAITGTEKQAVANDYSAMLNEAIKETEEPISTIIGTLLKKDGADKTVDLKFSNCLLANISICENSQKDRFVVAIQNPLSKTVSHYVHLPVDGENYKVTGSEGEENVKVDIFDAIHSFDFVPDSTKAVKELVFLAMDIPALGVKLYYVEKIDAADNYHKFEDVASDLPTTCGDNTNGFTVDNGKLKTVTINNVNRKITQDFYYYKGFGGSESAGSARASGAYIFRPDGSAIQVADKPKEVKVARGSLVDEVRQVFNDEITQIIRVYKYSANTYIEFDWLVGDLQLVGNEGKEVITRFTVDGFENNEIFYTDSNGRQKIKRRRNRRSDYNIIYSEEPVSSNYYPVTSKIAIVDETDDKNILQVAVLNDRAQGGSSLAEGQIELMIHRRDTKDDGFGVSEVLNEKEYGKGLYARGQHYLTFGKVNNALAAVERDLAHRKLLAPLVLVADATSEDLTLEKVQAALEFKYEVLKKELPENVQILTLEPWKDSYLLRLEHIYEKIDNPNLSKEASVDLTDLFTAFTITELTPMKLGANEELDTTVSKFGYRFEKIFKLKADTPDLTVSLKPMEIKTFVFKTDKENDGGYDNGIIDFHSRASALDSVSFLFVLISSFYWLLF